MRSMYETLLISVLFAVISIPAFGGGTKILHEDNAPNMGINVIPMSKSLWRGKVMRYPVKVTDKDRVWTGGDFFVDEFGKPCVFSRDWVKKYGYCSVGDYRIKNGSMVFTTGRKGFVFGFGPKPGDRSRPSLRLGKKWGRHMKDKYRLAMKIEQNVPETVWEYAPTNFKGVIGSRAKKFKISGKGVQTCKVDVGLVRELMTAGFGSCGFQLKCLTPNATVKVKSIRLAPSSAIVFFRKKFKLKEMPVMAHATFQASETYVLYLNGKNVSKGTNIYPCGTVKTVDLLPYLKKGENVIAFAREFMTWVDNSPEWVFEGVCVYRDGEIVRLLGDKSWKCALKATPKWMSADYDDGSWKIPALQERSSAGITNEYTADGKLAYTGIDPRHMGMIRTAPYKSKYPLFGQRKRARFKLELPAGVLGKYIPKLTVRETETGKLVETVPVPKPKITKSLISYIFSINTKTPGPYHLEWSLTDKNGKLIEKREDEMVIVGPIKQKTLPLAGFEKRFEKQLKLVRRIDCTKKPTDAREFLDHAGMYNKPKMNKGKVVSANNMSYRETGSGYFDYFAYRLHIKEKGEPYLIEIVVPDDKSRYIYSGVVEQFPVGFCNNWPRGQRGWFSATGTAYTGMDNPLSFGKKKIRYIYYPSSQAAAVLVMSGFRGSPAAACEINIYKVNGDLPALKVPATNRMFGSHNERISVMTHTLGMAEQPLMGGKRVRINGHHDGWYHWYKTFERKIKLLRFQGKNMTVEGVYMYTQGDYPSLKHNSSVSNDELDPLSLGVKMYNSNHIKCMVGVEYMASPQMLVSGIDTVSDRQMWRGTPGIFMVDKHGRQLVGSGKSGINFLNKKSGGILLDCVSEIYQRYQTAGDISGMFLVTGDWWAPGFVRGSYRDIQNTDVGYGDYTVGLFEKETGVNLGINDRTNKRFQMRYNQLMGKYRVKWLDWRANKLKEFLGEIAARIRKGAKNWHLYVLPSFSTKKDNPFKSIDGTKKERDAYMARRYTESGVPLEKYANDKEITIVTRLASWAKYRAATTTHLAERGWNTNPGSRKIIKASKAIYFLNHDGLDEVDCPATAAPEWLWSGTARGVFTPRAIGDYCMKEFVEVMTDETPKVIFYDWLDCNMETGFGSQLRRFSESYYATPEVDFTPLPADASKGVVAQIAKCDGREYLRLVNNTDYPIKGTITTDASVIRDLAYDKNLVGVGKYELSMKPEDIRIIMLKGAKGSVKCDFNMSPEDTREILGQGAFILKDPSIKKINKNLVANLKKALKNKNAFEAYGIMRDYEFASKANINGIKLNRRFTSNQKKLLSDLAKNRARIICASTKEYIDDKGNRWLPDQKFTDCGAYGNIGANAADRGDLPISGTNLDRVYQTEAYGDHVIYRIPVPKGKYNLYLHFAETYVKNKRPGCRQIVLKTEGVTYPRKIDPFVLAGGWAKPYVLKINDLAVKDGVIDIDLTSGVGISGIEVEKIK